MAFSFFNVIYKYIIAQKTKLLQLFEEKSAFLTAVFNLKKRKVKLCLIKIGEYDKIYIINFFYERR